MAIDPVKIPQDVTIEDRIIGPITLRQIFLCLIGGGVSYFIYAVLQRTGSVNLITGTLALLPFLTLAAFAFIKISGISLFRFCLLMLERGQKPPLRVWQPRTGLEIHSRKLVPSAPEKERISKNDTGTNSIDELSSVLDSGPLSGGKNTDIAIQQDDEDDSLIMDDAVEPASSAEETPDTDKTDQPAPANASASPTSNG